MPPIHFRYYSAVLDTIFLDLTSVPVDIAATLADGKQFLVEKLSATGVFLVKATGALSAAAIKGLQTGHPIGSGQDAKIIETAADTLWYAWAPDGGQLAITEAI